MTPTLSLKPGRSLQPRSTPFLASAARRAPAAAVALTLAAAGLGFAVQASAQELDAGATGGGAQWTLGLAAANAPRFEGSKEYKTRALPLINYRNGRFFAGALGGVGYNFSSTPDLAFGPLLSWRPGRDESDANRLRGLGDIEDAADLGAFVRWNLRPFFLHASIKQGISGEVKGAHGRVGVGYSMALSPADRVVFDASADWASSKVMQAWFGVTPAQALRSGLATYQAGSGLRRYGLGAKWTHNFSAQWFSTAGVAVYRLGNEAGDSPITVDRNQGLVSVGFGYRF